MLLLLAALLADLLGLVGVLLLWWRGVEGLLLLLCCRARVVNGGVDRRVVSCSYHPIRPAWSSASSAPASLVALVLVPPVVEGELGILHVVLLSVLSGGVRF